jgi:two-component system chemotaxis sensor kinase CheA
VTLRLLQGDASDATLEALGQARPEVQEALELFRHERAECAARWSARRPVVAGMAAAAMPSVPASAPVVGTSRPASANRAGHDDAAARSIRVDQRKLDEYINLAGELVIARNALAHEFRQAGLNPTQHRRLKESIDRVYRIVGDIQANAMLMRMVPVATLFQRFPRMVRDIARSLDKQLELRTVGEETELDKQVAERLADPLVHLVRNAADHGIEPPDVRRAAGKSETGTITLRAGREGGMIVLEIVDDGAGIPAERLKAKAVEQGLITPAQATAMSRHEALQLVFAAGLSTARAVSDLSGRGVGMDVVRNNLAELGGTVAVDSEPGQGTRFRLELPLTLAVTNVLLASVDEAVYAIPVDSIQETLRVAAGQLRQLNRQWVIPLRGQIVPVKPLRDLLGNQAERAGSPSPEASASANPDSQRSDGLEHRPVLVVRRAGSHYGLVVDRLLGQQEIVIKPLPGHLGKLPGVSGAAILGDGQVALILDPARLA